MEFWNRMNICKTKSFALTYTKTASNKKHETALSYFAVESLKATVNSYYKSSMQNFGDIFLIHV
jgi:hypothetical protein